MNKRFLVLLAGLLTGVAHAGAEDEPAQWLVVTAPAFRAELAPLIEHRKAEGLKVVVVETTNLLTREQIGNAIPLHAHIRELFEQTKGPKYLLLAGAVAASDPATAEQILVPTLSGTIGRMKGPPLQVPRSQIASWLRSNGLGARREISPEDLWASYCVDGLAASDGGGRLIFSPSMFTGPWICCKKLSDFEPDATLLH
jgi:hypothetical protein